MDVLLTIILLINLTIAIIISNLEFLEYDISINHKKFKISDLNNIGGIIPLDRLEW